MRARVGVFVRLLFRVCVCVCVCVCTVRKGLETQNTLYIHTYIHTYVRMYMDTNIFCLDLPVLVYARERYELLKLVESETIDKKRGLMRILVRTYEFRRTSSILGI